MTNEFRRNNKVSSKLSHADVRLIRRRYEAGEATQGQLARDYGVSAVQIGRIVRYESWADLPPEPSADSLQRSAEALLRTQEERSLEEKFEQHLALQKEVNRLGDSAVEELKTYNPSAEEKARKLRGE